MAFFETEFPTAVSFLAQGGPVFSTTVNEGFSGGEQRNRNWQLTRGEWTIDLSFKPIDYFEQAHAFFLNVGGMADSFRFKDHKDFQAVGQIIGLGNGANTTFQLTKTYVSGNRQYVRPITKPITSAITDFQGNSLPDTVRIYIGSVLQVLNSDYTVDETTGIVTFLAGHIPVLTSPQTHIFADCEFHYPVRFMSDALSAQLEESDVEGGNALVSWQQIQVREVKI